ncbi:anaphase-promoting complex subunit 2 [Fusarium austroafricanum]|uniref:Anaphase-promoting complex subunit 2 n=1 Tax=Fusarium austroafricanum TaxID=2364996 RepID=A0A8H4KSW3_9HYPO|nr:anaphase-promoting complex subunit 2 [Fusarium austroafricanum]
MAMTASRYRARKQKVFRSVFQSDVPSPTPRSTPVAVFTDQGAAFGGPHASSHHAPPPPPLFHQTLHHADDQVRWDRAWHVVTSKIQLPTSVAVEDSFGTLPPESQDVDLDFRDSLALLLYPDRSLPQATHTEDILLWHTHQVRQHFIHHVMPLLAACASQGDHTQVLLSSISTLEAAHRQYLWGLTLIAQGYEEEVPASTASSNFRRDLHAIIGNSLNQGMTNALTSVLRRLIRLNLGIGKRYDGNLPWPESQDDGGDPVARKELLGLLESLQNVGLVGEKFQVLFAEIMDASMEDFIKTSYSGVWKASEQSETSSSSALTGCLGHLSDWVENHYGRLAVEVFSRLETHIAWNDVECWKDIAIGRLATLRIRELFDISLNWPESRGGLEDLRLAVTTPQRRLQLTDTFSLALQKRLLHPGRSTSDILQTYISMIRTFHALDHSKVLLDRVVHALQLYLCQRDDAIRIVVTGLLSNPSEADTEEGKTKLAELAVLLNSASQQQRRQVDDEDLDWNDMTWVPDPVDAGVNYKRPRNEDVIGTLINALGSQDIFIKEFQLIIAERLLSSQASFVQETKVLSLLKKRFGDNALQNCDVMMKDIQDSKRVDAVLGKNIRQSSNDPGAVSYHSKILSRLFWPSLPKDPFTVPPPVAEMQARYEQGFERLKTSRKLTWLDQLGSATVRLDLEDRSVELECKTYEAAVIYAFQDVNSTGPDQHTFDEIWQRLMIDEDLLELALKFWVSKRVLRDVGNRTYIVLERLDDGNEAGEANAPDEDQDPGDGGRSSPRKPKIDPKEQERRTVYWQFIVGMLTNSAPTMPLGQMLMMMKMLIPDGCSWSNEELQEFLAEKVAENKLELAGGKYRLPKK